MLPFTDEKTRGLSCPDMQEAVAGQPAPCRDVMTGRPTISNDFKDRSSRQGADRPDEADQQIGARGLARIEDVIGSRRCSRDAPVLHIALPRRM
jgi:hypothetical protein